MGRSAVARPVTRARRSDHVQESHVMSMSFGGWSVLGIAAAVLIVAGIVLLIAYAVERGLVHRELDGTVASDGATGTLPDAHVRGSGRTLGVVGAVALVVGLLLGLLSAVTGWGGMGTGLGVGPGTGPRDCAQSWNGCPQVTPAP